MKLFADIAAGYALSYLDQVLREIDWRTAYQNLKRLADRLSQRDSFRNKTSGSESHFSSRRGDFRWCSQIFA